MLGATAFLLIFCAQLGARGDTITLLDEVYVTGPKLMLSDIADIRGENAALLADVEVAPAAAPGAVKRVDAAYVRSRVRALGIEDDTVEVLGARQVTATTMYLDITRDMIAEDLRAHIEMEMPWAMTDTIIDVAKPPQDYVVPDGEIEFRWQRGPNYNFLGLGAFRCEIFVNGNLERTFHARANVQTYGEVVVAATDLRRGDMLSHRTLRLEKQELSSVTRGAYYRIEDVEGQLAKSSMLEGQVIVNRKVMAPTLVKRNEIVVVETRVGALTVQTRAKALGDGIEGETVRCMNLGSKDEFVGVVLPNGTVYVQ